MYTDDYGFLPVLIGSAAFNFNSKQGDELVEVNDYNFLVAERYHAEGCIKFLKAQFGPYTRYTVTEPRHKTKTIFVNFENKKFSFTWSIEDGNTTDTFYSSSPYYKGKARMFGMYCAVLPQPDVYIMYWANRFNRRNFEKTHRIIQLLRRYHTSVQFDSDVMQKRIDEVKSVPLQKLPAPDKNEEDWTLATLKYGDEPRRNVYKVFEGQEGIAEGEKWPGDDIPFLLLEEIYCHAIMKYSFEDIQMSPRRLTLQAAYDVCCDHNRTHKFRTYAWSNLDRVSLMFSTSFIEKILLGKSKCQN